MDSARYKEAVAYLSDDDRELLRQLGDHTGEDGVTVAMDMQIRRGLASALGDMGNSVQLLLTLLDRSGLEIPQREMPSYDRLLEGIAAAATSGANWVTRSQQFDKEALLALTPQTSSWMQ